MTEDICDFCSSTPVRWSFPARDLSARKIPGVPDFNSEGAWAACEPCAALIRACDRDGLAERATEQFVKKYGGRDIPRALPRALLLAELRDLFDRFWSNREGTPTPVC